MKMDEVFPFGTHVYREPSAPFEEIAGDLRIARRLGFNMVKVQESWAMDEPREGEIDLSRVERVILEAKSLGLGVYLGLTMEQAPAWLWRKYPDCHPVYADGRPHNDPTQYLLPADGKPGPCWDHPGAREAAELFMADLARRLGRHENIWVWNVWQEVGFRPHDGGVLGFCYCPYMLTRFREWLHRRYGELAALNAAWRTAFGQWKEVEPPRRQAAVPSAADWRYFMDDIYLARALRWKADTIRRNDPEQRPVFCHVGSPQIGSGAEWRWARAVDFFGNSNYPLWWCFDTEWDDARPRAGTAVSARASFLQEMWDGIALRTDYARCAGGNERPFWGAEFQGGPVCTRLRRGRVPRPVDIRRWLLTGLASGMSGISFWNLRAEIFGMEANGFGLLDSTGNTTERAEEVGRLGRGLQRHANLFRDGRPPRANVAMVINEDAWHFARTLGDNADRHLSYDIRGLYCMLWEQGIPVDFVEAREVLDGQADDYPALILPFPIALDNELIVHLGAYVGSGGFLLSEACPGRFDRYGLCPRGEMAPAARDLFGAMHHSLTTCREPENDARWTPAERAWNDQRPPAQLSGIGPFEGFEISANLYLQTFSPTDATPVLMCGGEIAGVLNNVGRGRAMLVGTFLGHSATAHRNRRNAAFLTHALALASVTPDRCGVLLRRRRVHGNVEAWFLTNILDSEVTENLEVAGFREVEDLLGEQLRRQGDTVEVTVPSLEVRCIVLRRH